MHLFLFPITCCGNKGKVLFVVLRSGPFWLVLLLWGCYHNGFGYGKAEQVITERGDLGLNQANCCILERIEVSSRKLWAFWHTIMGFKVFGKSFPSQNIFCDFNHCLDWLLHVSQDMSPLYCEPCIALFSFLVLIDCLGVSLNVIYANWRLALLSTINILNSNIVITHNNFSWLLLKYNS